jgi:hypothetical protein
MGNAARQITLPTLVREHLQTIVHRLLPRKPVARVNQLHLQRHLQPNNNHKRRAQAHRKKANPRDKEIAQRKPTSGSGIATSIAKTVAPIDLDMFPASAAITADASCARKNYARLSILHPRNLTNSGRQRNFEFAKLTRTYRMVRWSIPITLNSTDKPF